MYAHACPPVEIIWISHDKGLLGASFALLKSYTGEQTIGEILAFIEVRDLIHGHCIIILNVCSFGAKIICPPKLFL